VTADNLWRSPPPDELIGERFLRLLLADGLVDPAWADPVPRIALTPDELETAERRVRQALGERAGPLAPAATGAGPSFAPRVLLVPEAGMSIKRWGAERFRTLAGELAAGGAAVLVPVAGEPELGRAAVGGVPGAVVLPPLGLREAAAVCTRTDLVIGGDTGLVRVAAAVGTPTVALFGPTWAGRFGLGAGAVDLQSPFDCPERRPENMTEQRCWYSGRCVYEEKASCMEDISVAAVLARARELLALPAEVRA
jgi:ADP-heptose:LPS heptosyltransferase